MPIDNRIYELLGMVTAEWSYLEERLRVAVVLHASYGLVKIHEPSRILVAGTSFDGQVDVLKTFLAKGPLADPGGLRWVRAWAKNVEGPRRQRNTVIHATSVCDAESDGPAALAVDPGSRKTRLGQDFHAFPVGMAGLGTLIDEIRERQNEMAAWTMEQRHRHWPPIATTLPSEWPCADA
jgi:hypothetical protein